jgi:hypothetical protein
MNGAIRISAALIAAIALYAYTQGKDEKSFAADARQAAVSKALTKMDYVEAANIRECMDKFGTSENISASIKGQILECRTKRGHLIGSL